MKRRPSVLWAPAIAAALTLTAQAAVARADSLPTYRLTSSVDIPAAAAPTAATLANPDPQVVINVLPPGAVTPVQNGVDATGNPIYDLPLQALPSSAGIDPNFDNLGIFLKPPPGTPNGGSQQLGLIFSDGLKSAANGGHLDFSLSVDKALGTPLLKATDPNIQIAQLDLSSTTGSTTGSTATSTTGSTSGTTTTTPTAPSASTVNTPEPVSVILWAAVVGTLALRANAYRRRLSA